MTWSKNIGHRLKLGRLNSPIFSDSDLAQLIRNSSKLPFQTGMTALGCISQLTPPWVLAIEMAKAGVPSRQKY
jgi:hypothetical protein